MMIAIGMFEDDAPGAVYLDKNILVRIIGSIGPTHYRAPASAGSEVEFVKRVGESVWSPPSRKLPRIGKRLEEAFGSSFENTRVNDFTISVDRGGRFGILGHKKRNSG